MYREGPFGPAQGYVLIAFRTRRFGQLRDRATVTAEWSLPTPGRDWVDVHAAKAPDVAEYAIAMFRAGRTPVMKDAPILQRR